MVKTKKWSSYWDESHKHYQRFIKEKGPLFDGFSIKEEYDECEEYGPHHREVEITINFKTINTKQLNMIRAAVKTFTEEFATYSDHIKEFDKLWKEKEEITDK